MKIYMIENHPADSRVKIDKTGTCQTLSARCGTGGGNTPMILMALGETNVNASATDGTVSPCVLSRAGTGGGNEPIILEVRDEGISKDHRGIMRQQPSGELHRTGCVQRYAPGLQEE